MFGVFSHSVPVLYFCLRFQRSRRGADFLEVEQALGACSVETLL